MPPALRRSHVGATISLDRLAKPQKWNAYASYLDRLVGRHHKLLRMIPLCTCETTTRCVDYVYYYPDQKVPSSGSCGLMFCGGGIIGASELSADSDFNRTFGMVDTCTASADGEVRRGSGHMHFSVKSAFVGTKTCIIEPIQHRLVAPPRVALRINVSLLQCFGSRGTYSVPFNSLV